MFKHEVLTVLRAEVQGDQQICTSTSTAPPIRGEALFRNLFCHLTAQISMEISQMQPLHRLAPVCGTRSFATLNQLAYSQRILPPLARRARSYITSMALVEVPETGGQPLEKKKTMEETPSVLVTPCDPWPRPYYLENGLRRVAPYHYTYNTYCKERWRGKELLDIFTSEFRDRPLEYYVCCAITWKLHGVLVLTKLERCNRTRKCCRKWQTCTDTKPYCEEWRCYFAYASSA